MKKTIGLLILAIAVAMILVTTLKTSQDSGKGFHDHRIIAHAMGGVNGHEYTNSQEAFVVNYEQGTRIFEVDLMLTTEGNVVARHEWKDDTSEELGQLWDVPSDRVGERWSHKEFMETPILGVYTPLDWDRVLDLMQQYPDAYILTDTKEFDTDMIPEQIKAIVDATSHRDPALLDRIIPQIYNRPMLEELVKIDTFKNMVYTLYASDDSDADILEFVKETGVDIAMPMDRANKKFISSLKESGAMVFVHTINKEQDIRKMDKMGADGFITDFIAEEDLYNRKGVLSGIW